MITIMYRLQVAGQGAEPADSVVWEGDVSIHLPLPPGYELWLLSAFGGWGKETDIEPPGLVQPLVCGDKEASKLGAWVVVHLQQPGAAGLASGVSLFQLIDGPATSFINEKAAVDVGLAVEDEEHQVGSPGRQSWQ